MELEHDLRRWMVAAKPWRLLCAAFLLLLVCGPLGAGSAGATPVVLDFSTEDDGTTPLQNGQSIQVGDEFGRLVNIRSQTAATDLGPAIFDSDPNGPNAGGIDPDLLVNLGNLLILQSTDSPNMTGDFFDTPDDEAGGGTLIFDFLVSGGVELLSVDLVDVDDEADEFANVTLVDTNGWTRMIHVPQFWTRDIDLMGPLGWGRLDLTTLASQPPEDPNGAPAFVTWNDTSFDPTAVVRMEVAFGSSAGIDNVTFVPEPGSLLLLGLALGGVGLLRRHRLG